MKPGDGLIPPFTEQLAKRVGPAGIDIAYERLGDPAAPPALRPELARRIAAHIKRAEATCKGAAGKRVAVAES